MWKTINGKKVNIGGTTHKRHSDDRFEMKKKRSENDRKHDPNFTFELGFSKKEKESLIEDIPKWYDDDMLEFDEDVTKSDINNVVAKLKSGNSQFTKQDAKIIYMVSSGLGTMGDNPDKQQERIMGDIFGKVWGKNHLWSKGFSKYNSQKEVQKANREESESFTRNFKGFDKNKNMTFTGGNIPVWDQYGKHLVTGKSIHDD